jgi:hypothetical protein
MHKGGAVAEGLMKETFPSKIRQQQEQEQQMPLWAQHQQHQQQ